MAANFHFLLGGSRRGFWHCGGIRLWQERADAAITGLLPGAEITGEVLFQGQDLLKMSQKELQDLRGSHIGMVFQDPHSSLHPYFTIGSQITEMIHYPPQDQRRRSARTYGGHARKGWALRMQRAG